MSLERIVLFTPKAEEDLEMIYAYTVSKWGHSQAEKYINQLYSSIDEISRFPGLGVEYASDKMRYRKIVVRKHIIYFRESDFQIIVVRILHSKMNHEKRLR